MEQVGKIQVSADVAANCIRLSFIGRITSAELERDHLNVERALRALRSGYSLVTDFTDLEEMAIDSAPMIDRTMELMKSTGVGLVVRVIPDPSKDPGVSILSLFHLPRSLKIVTTETRDEAEAILREA
jgi:hypothetical protein